VSPDDEIPLLSGKPLGEFTPGEFKEHVRGLFRKKPPKAGGKGKKRLRDRSVKGRILKSGKISVTTTRDPKYVSPEEFSALSKTLERGENEIFLAVRKGGLQILNHEEAEEIRKRIGEIPF